jgi:hypothetical protein
MVLSDPVVNQNGRTIRAIEGLKIQSASLEGMRNGKTDTLDTPKQSEAGVDMPKDAGLRPRLSLLTIEIICKHVPSRQ